MLGRFQFRLARKSYLRGKRVYEYGRISLNMPKKYHPLIIPLLKRDMEIKVTAQDGGVLISVNPRSEVSVAEAPATIHTKQPNSF